MYNVIGFGKRIASYRKLSCLTQEELATKLNITAQAVSKWENEISFPEITALPQLAQVLNTTIEKLFGNEDNGSINDVIKSKNIPKFKERKGESLKLVHVFGGTACYSEKEPDVTSLDTVVFKDGSCADLRQLTVINKGPGDICFDFIEGFPAYYENIDMSKTEMKDVFESVDSFDLTISNADFTLTGSHDDKTHVKATGSPIFIGGLKLEKIGGILAIKCSNENNSSSNIHGRNTVIINYGKDAGKSIKASLNGSGNVSIEVPFNVGYFAVNGSGDITVDNINEFEAKINGSGDITGKRIGDSKIGINGSGDLNCKEVFGNFKASINGSGDIKTGVGKLDSLDVTIRGSGDVDAIDVTTDTANIVVQGSGNVVIGRIIKESIEKHSKNSTIKVLKRG